MSRDERINLSSIDELVKSQFVEMFGDPVENPKGWTVKKLGELGVFKNGVNFNPRETGGSVRCLGVADFKERDIVSSISEIPMISISEKPTIEQMLQKGDYVFVRSNGNKELVGRCVMVGFAESGAIFSGFCIRMRLKMVKQPNQIFLLALLRNQSTRKLFHGRGASIQNLNQQILETAPVILPPRHLQDRFAEFVAAADKSKFAVRQWLTKRDNWIRMLAKMAFG